MAKSKSAMIMELKGRGMKGSLSRMNKSKLMELLESTAADGASHGISSGAAPQHAPITTAVAPDISLAAVPDAKPSYTVKGGGHQPKKSQKTHAYREFVRKHGSEFGGDMKKISDAYHSQQSGSGSSHDKFMKATDTYCEQKGSGLVQSGEGYDATDVTAYMKGGSFWHDVWGDVKTAGSIVAKAAPYTAEIPLIGPEVAAAAETVGQAANAAGTVGKALTNS